MTLDTQIRMAAFDWLAKQIKLYNDDVLPRTILAQGFTFNGKRIPLVSPQGIFKPKLMDYPLTITTTVEGPYDDDIIYQEDLINYRYRGTDPNHSDNVGLRNAMNDRIPLIYFFGLVPGKYLVVRPVYIVGDDPASLTFKVTVDNQLIFDQDNQTIWYLMIILHDAHILPQP